MVNPGNVKHEFTTKPQKHEEVNVGRANSSCFGVVVVKRVGVGQGKNYAWARATATRLPLRLVSNGSPARLP